MKENTSSVFKLSLCMCVCVCRAREQTLWHMKLKFGHSILWVHNSTRFFHFYKFSFLRVFFSINRTRSKNKFCRRDLKFGTYLVLIRNYNFWKFQVATTNLRRVAKARKSILPNFMPPLLGVGLCWKLQTFQTYMSLSAPELYQLSDLFYQPTPSYSAPKITENV